MNQQTFPQRHSTLIAGALMKNLIRRNIKVLLCASSLTALGGVYFAGRASASGVPQQEPLIYSGQLTDEEGVPSNGEFDIEIVLWSSSTSDDSSERLCETASPGHSVEGGFFSVVLDQDCFAGISEQPNSWVEVFVDDESLGRSKIGAVPYALEAHHATSASAAQEGGALAAQLTDLESRLSGLETRASGLETRASELEDRADASEEQTAGYDSGWLPITAGDEIVLEHGLGEIPSSVNVMVRANESAPAQQAGWAFRWDDDDDGLRGTVVQDATTTELVVRSGVVGQAYSTGIYDTPGNVPRVGLSGGFVRVRAWR